MSTQTIRAGFPLLLTAAIVAACSLSARLYYDAREEILTASAMGAEVLVCQAE